MGRIKRTLSRGAFVYVEEILESYPRLQKELEKAREKIEQEVREIILSTYSPDLRLEGAGRSNLPSDPTGSRAVKTSELALYRDIRELEDNLEIVGDVLYRVEPFKREVIKSYYWDKPRILTWEGIARKVGANRSAAIKWRNEIVREIAKRKGLR